MTTITNFAKFLILSAIIITASCIKEDETEFTPEREAAIISRYIDSLITKGYDIDTTVNGVFYAIVDEGEGGIMVQPGDSIGVIYMGFFPESGNIFDASEYHYGVDGVWKYTYKSMDLIPGFDEAVGLLWEGAEGLFLIPSSQAYGSQGSWDGSIPPYSPLVFDIKLVEIYQ
jgi:FKBP-type peptidyl-prolyl cis-trans isomerase FkpA